MRKILRSGKTDFTFEPERQPLPMVGPWIGHVDRFLFGNGGNADAQVPLYHAPDEACPSDRSHETVLIYGVTVTETVKVAHARLCRSRVDHKFHAQRAWGGPICARAVRRGIGLELMVPGWLVVSCA